MSKPAAISFIHRVNADDELRARIETVEGNLAGLIAIASGAGFTFDEADWNAAVAEVVSGGSGDLSDAELANVSGGISAGAVQTTFGDWGASFLSRKMGKFL